MINGLLGQWLDEARSHWQHMLASGAAIKEDAYQSWQHGLAAAAVIKQTLPFAEWIRIAVVALITAVVTSQITLARLDERITALTSEREIIIKNRDGQMSELKAHNAAQDAKLDMLLHKVSLIEGRIK